MSEVLQFLERTNGIWILIPLSGIGLGVVSVVMTFWYRLRVRQWELSLKHAMLERGMSAEEIKLVLEATGKKPWERCWEHMDRRQRV